MRSDTTLQLISAVSSEAITHWLSSLPPLGEGKERAFLLNDAGVSGVSLQHLPLPDTVLKKSVVACACCVGLLALRVELARLLRAAPAQIVVVSTHWAHLAVLDAVLSSAPFDQFTVRLPSQLVLSASQAEPTKRDQLLALVGNWKSEWVVTNI